MRLICPHCDAQYEVADNVIPDEGRDVQCSNCGTTWFQESAATVATSESDDQAGSDETAEAPEPESEPEPEVIAEKEPIDIPKPRRVDVSFDPVGGTDDEDETEDTAQFPTDDGPVPKSTVSDESAAILREEAMRELKERLAEGSRLETQDELGISEPTPQAAKPRNVEPVPVPVPVPMPNDGPKGVSRDPETSEAVSRTVRPNRSKLPDIEEINSTLSAESTRKALAMDSDEEGTSGNARRTGFRIGFLAAMIIAIAALGTYVYAPRIAQSYPDAAPALAAYVERTDGIRLWFDGWVNRSVHSLTKTMDSMVSGS